MEFSIRTGNGAACGRLAVRETRDDGIAVVWADVLCETALDPDEGVIIGIGGLSGSDFTADWRHSEFWCRPWFGQSLRDVPEETYCLIAKDGKEYTVLLAVTGDTYKCVLTGTEEGLEARLFSWCRGLNRCDAPAFVWGRGQDVFDIMRRCAGAASRAAGGFCPTREARAYPEIFEYLGWCSWDAMEIRVCEKDLLEKCREFRDKGIPVRWAILDDMWADVPDFVGAEYSNRPEMFRLMHASRLRSFEAAPERFPGGLARCIGRMNEMGFTVGMWHPTTGYWQGIDPDGPLFREYRDCLFQTEDGQWIPKPEKLAAFRFYDGFHSYLQSCGARFVKVDNQSMYRSFYKGSGPVGKVMREVHTAIDASAGAHFGGAMINCMGMASEDQWSRPSSAVSRCSDDFLPENRDWFTKHILQCAFNSLVQGQLYWCDWDMWWTDDGQAEKNSVLRAISGGPVYVSDPLGRSRGEVLEPLCLSDGRILRCDRPAMPAPESLFGDPETSGRAFVLQNLTGGCGVLAAFNLRSDGGAVVGHVSPADVPGLRGETFALWERFTGEMRILTRDEIWEFTLRDRDDYRLWIAAPYIDGCAVIGMAEKFIAPAAVADRIGREARLREPGTLLRVLDGKLCASKQDTV